MKRYTYLEIGNRLRELRKRLKLSQREFSKTINLHINTYQRYESGETLPPEPVLKRVAEVCGKTVDWLLGRDPLQMVIAEEKAHYNAEKQGIEKLEKNLEEPLYISKLVAILQGKNRKNASAIKENIDAFYDTRDIVPGELKKLENAG